VLPSAPFNKACTKCGACLIECPTGSILEAKDQYIIDTDTCDNHAACVAVCPVNAITLVVETKAPKKPEAKKPEGKK
jgi:ferredoxin